MILITRRQVRTLRGVFRRSALGIAHRGPLPPLVFQADGDLVRVRYTSADLAVEQTLPAAGRSSGTVLLPLDALADLEGRGDALLGLDPVAPDRTVARWSDRDIPQSRDYTRPGRSEPVPFPEWPSTWAEAPANLLEALEAATETTDTGSTRYALDCLLLYTTPTGGELAATNGHQALVRGGFTWPWEGDVLVAGTPLFACRALPRERPWALGRTQSHLVLRGEATTLALPIRTGGRFPRVAEIFSDPAAATTRLRLDPADALFLAESLHRLPGAGEALAAVTVDLNGHIAVRARGRTDVTATELVLTRSSYTGVPARFDTDRTLLDRALRLGFTEIELGAPAAPLVCRAGALAYAWQPLTGDAPILADTVGVRIESPTPVRAGVEPVRPAPVQASPPAPPLSPTHPALAASPRLATTDEPEATGIAALICEAEALHEALGSARDRSRRLVLALKQHRKQTRLMAATLRSLRHLGLQEVAG